MAPDSAFRCRWPARFGPTLIGPVGNRGTLGHFRFTLVHRKCPIYFFNRKFVVANESICLGFALTAGLAEAAAARCLDDENVARVHGGAVGWAQFLDLAV